MNRRAALRSLVVGAGSLFPGLARANQPNPNVGSERNVFPVLPPPKNGPEKDDLILRSEVRLVLLDVSVKDTKGGYAAGLSRENFSIFENGKQQPITVFDHNDAPVTVGLLVDESRSMTPKRAQVLTAAETLIAESNPLDEIFVLNFNDQVTPGLPGNQPFSDNIEELRKALQRGVPAGKTAIYDAVVTGLKHLELGTRDKKTLVLISDGGDNASHTTRHDALDQVQRSIATIYTVGLFEADDPDRDPGLLRHLAKVSGGESYLPKSPEEMVPVCQRIAKEIRSRYTVGYRPQAEGGSQRHLAVHASAPGHGRLIAHTRGSYFYDAAEIQKK